MRDAEFLFEKKDKKSHFFTFFAKREAWNCLLKKKQDFTIIPAHFPEVAPDIFFWNQL